MKKLNNAKKLIALILLNIFSVANASNFGWTSSDTVQINKGGNSTTFHANSDTSMFLSLNSGKSDTLYGFYKLDSSNKIVEMLGVSADFFAGDVIGIWLESDGNTLFSSHELNKDGITYDGWQLNDDKDMLIFGYELSGKPYNGFDNLDVKLNVSTKVPSGQPLPGVLASALIVGGTLFFFSKKKKA